MTLEEANLIWFDCYGPGANGWDRYTTEQRLQAIETRNGGPDDSGTWGVWNISDRD